MKMKNLLEMNFLEYNNRNGKNWICFRLLVERIEIHWHYEMDDDSISWYFRDVEIKTEVFEHLKYLA